MRCPQCGFNAEPQATFCSRCGARLHAARPENRREYALVRIYPSWWRFAGPIVIAILLLGASGWMAAHGQQEPAVVAFLASVVVFLLTILVRRSTSWSITSERLIEYRGLLLTRRLEIELADIRSVEVTRRLMQRLKGLGNILVASAASTDFLIKLEDLARPDDIAEMLRQARLKRLA